MINTYSIAVVGAVDWVDEPSEASWEVIVVVIGKGRVDLDL